MNRVLEVKGLRKSYGSKVAVQNLDLTVSKGEIFGLLGQNGAGKSTTIECILNTRKRDSGTITMLGMDPLHDRKDLFARVGVQFQSTRFQDKLRVGEACEVADSLYPHTQDWRALLARFHLEDKIKMVVNELSGGEKQKLSVVLALIPEPELLFLDELTTGLDPKARREVWAHLKELKEKGVTIVLTSHYMDEVEHLCDRIAVLKNGAIMEQGSPQELISRCGTKNLEDAFLLFMDKEETEEAV